jgi:hypothetical protein
MRIRVGIAVLVCVSACADADHSDTEPAPEGGTERVALRGSVWAGKLPLADVQVCQEQPEHCTVTDSNGEFVLDGLIPNSEILIVYRKDGYRPTLQPIVTPRWSTGTLFAASLLGPPSIADDNALLRAAGLPTWDDFDATKDQRATVAFNAASNAIDSNALTAAVQVTLDPSSGFGPFYIQEAGGPATLNLGPDQVATLGYFRGVEARAEGYELVYVHRQGDCRYQAGPVGGWPAASGRPNATHVPARAGCVTAMTQESCLTRDAADSP